MTDNADCCPKCFSHYCLKNLSSFLATKNGKTVIATARIDYSNPDYRKDLSHLQTRRTVKCHIIQAEVFLLSHVPLDLYAGIFNWTLLGRSRSFANPFCP